MAFPVTIDWSKINNPEQTFQRFASRRSVVYGTKGVVSSSQPLATEAGLEILRKGGNAGQCCILVPTESLALKTKLLLLSADAAVATSVALNVTEPSCCGIGG